MVSQALKLFVVLLFPVSAMGQSLDLSVDSQTSANSTSTFTIGKSAVTLSGQSIQFSDSNSQHPFEAVGISKDHSLVGTLSWSGQKGNVQLFKPNGKKLLSYETITLADEASFGLYVLADGSTFLRDKIANFTFYDTFGQLVTSVSNSSQSKGGEAISEVATSESGNTLVLYNPKIKRGDKLGSKAQVRTGPKSFEDIYFSNDRYLKEVRVSSDGSLIALITAREGTDDKVIITDKFGNDINTIEAEEDLKSVRFTDDLEQLTIYSGGRVMVHNTLSGESLGATSLRSPVMIADYFPQDNLILAVTGSYSERSGLLNRVSFRAINLKQRSIASKDFSGALGFSDAISISLERSGNNNYVLKGANKQVMIEANF